MNFSKAKYKILHMGLVSPHGPHLHYRQREGLVESSPAKKHLEVLVN